MQSPRPFDLVLSPNNKRFVPNVFLYLPANEFRELEEMITFDRSICKYISWHRSANSEWSQTGQFDTVEEAVLSCLLINDIPDNAKRVNSARFKRLAEQGLGGIFYGSYGAVSREDIEQAGYDPSGLSDEDMRNLANDMDDDGITGQYWISLEYLCESWGLPELPEENEDENEENEESAPETEIA
jgi:hypothetical protein